MTRAIVFSALLGSSFLSMSAARSDTVTLRDRKYENVYVIEGPRAYYLCVPGDGKTVSIAKSDSQLVEVKIEKDAAARAALYAEFNARKVQRERADTQEAAAAPTNVELKFELGSPDPQPAAKPAVPVLRLKGEPSGYIPGLRSGFGTDPGTDTRQSPPPGGGGGMGGGGGLGGGGGGGFGGGGGAGGFGAGGGGGGGVPAGGQGGGGRGGGGGAGGGRGGNGPGVGFSNISDFFFTVDDRSVGESPNPITGR